MGGVPRFGGTSIFSMTTPFRRVLVEETTQYEATVRDLGSGTSFSVQTTTPSGRHPRPGDIWYVSNELGVWTFHKMIDSGSDAQAMSTQLAFMNEMNERHEVSWRPFENPRSATVEVPQGAYIGERRIFETAPNERWLPMDGSDQSRHRYQALFDQIGETYGPGDGITTFTMPTQDDAYVSTGVMLASYQKYSITGGVDPTATTTLTNIPGLSHTFIIPALATPSDYEVEVIATFAVDNVYATAGLPDSEILLRLNGSTYTDGFTHSLLCRPVANGLVTLTGTWRVTFAATGSHTITMAISKADATGTITLLRQNTGMSVKLFRAGGSVTVSGSASWYICAE